MKDRKSIKVTIAIPDSIWSSDREYKLLHNHGEITLINGNASNKKFTFETKDFSEFAFLYRTRSAADKDKNKENVI